MCVCGVCEFGRCAMWLLCVGCVPLLSRKWERWSRTIVGTGGIGPVGCLVERCAVYLFARAVASVSRLPPGAV